MKKYRIVYWFGSIKTDWIVKANSEEEAREEFIRIKGNKEIVRIEEVE